MKRIIKSFLMIFVFILIVNTDVVYGACKQNCTGCAGHLTEKCVCNNFNNGEIKLLDNTNTNTNGNLYENSPLDCSSDGVRKTMFILGTVLNWIQVLVPVFVVITGIVALFKAVMSSDDSLIKKAARGLLVKVFIAAAVIFLPMIVFAIAGYIDSYNPSSTYGCIECIDKPSNCTTSWD